MTSIANRDLANISGEIEILGKRPFFDGPYSDIYRGKYDGQMVAVKALKPVGRIQTIKRKILRERVVWGALDHPNILPCIGYAEDNERFGPYGAFIAPWCANRDMFMYLTQYGSDMSLDQRVAMWKGVVEGVNYLHQFDPIIVHGNLNPANILLDDNLTPRICVLGLTRLMSEEDGSLSTITTMDTGAERYISYELVDHDDMVMPTAASDVHALGCVGLEIIFLQIPYSHHKNNIHGQIFLDIRKGVPPAPRPVNLYGVKERCWDIISSCWSRGPATRPDTKALLSALQTDILLHTEPDGPCSPHLRTGGLGAVKVGVAETGTDEIAHVPQANVEEDEVAHIPQAGSTSAGTWGTPSASNQVTESTEGNREEPNLDSHSSSRRQVQGDEGWRVRRPAQLPSIRPYNMPSQAENELFCKFPRCQASFKQQKDFDKHVERAHGSIVLSDSNNFVLSIKEINDQLRDIPGHPLIEESHTYTGLKGWTVTYSYKKEMIGRGDPAASLDEARLSAACRALHNTSLRKPGYLNMARKVRGIRLTPQRGMRLTDMITRSGARRMMPISPTSHPPQIPLEDPPQYHLTIASRAQNLSRLPPQQLIPHQQRPVHPHERYIPFDPNLYTHEGTVPLQYPSTSATPTQLLSPALARHSGVDPSHGQPRRYSGSHPIDTSKPSDESDADELMDTLDDLDMVEEL
ncbi:hypothetical protein FRC15_000561 [Serendipita sp. 397]|nr:hypothetical protein FRC15_000561 [Serendipita sp. 397]